MVASNFSFGADFVSIDYQDHGLDVHNCYNLVGFVHNASAETAEITFKKGTGSWIREEELDGFSIRFEYVTAVYTKGHDDDYPREHLAHDGGTVNLMGFMYGDGEDMDGVSSHEPDPELPSVIFCFVTGKAIKVTAERAMLIVTQ